MNKLIAAMFVLCTIAPMAAMETQSVITITQEENAAFMKHLNLVCSVSEQYVKDKKITANNGIYVILNQLSQNLTKQENKVDNIIQSEDLHSRLQEYKNIESDPVVKNLYQSLENNKKIASEDEQALKKSIKDARVKLAREELMQKWPQYSMPQAGQQVQSNPSDFLVRNENYPANNAEAVKDYLAMFIYQLIIAPRVGEINT